MTPEQIAKKFTPEKRAKPLADAIRKAVMSERATAKELWTHLRYVWMLAGRLGRGPHREEALALMDGTLRAAETVLKKHEALSR